MATWLTKFGRRFGGLFTKAGWSVSTFINTDNVAPLISGDNYVTAYTGNPWVAACIRAIATDAAALPLVLKDQAGEPVESSPVIDLLNYVNEGMDQVRLLQATSGWLDLNGNAYWRKDYPTKPAALYPLPANHVKLAPKLAAYEFRRDGSDNKVEVIPIEEIIHFKLWNPASDLYGMSPIQPAESSINLDHNIRTLNGKFVKRGAIPSALLKSDQPVGDEQMKQLRAQWDNVYSGTANAGKLMILGGGLEYTQVSLSGKDAMFYELAKLSREEILAIFGVPPVRVGILEYASYANATQQMRAYYENTILPRMDLVCNTLNEFLLPSFGLRGHTLGAETSGIAALQDDAQARATRLALATGGQPWLTPDEAREEDGERDALPGGVGAKVYADPTKLPLGEKPPAPPKVMVRPIAPGMPGGADRGEEAMPHGQETAPEEVGQGTAGRGSPKGFAAQSGASLSLER